MRQLSVRQSHCHCDGQGLERDLRDAQALIHKSELSWDRIMRPEQVVKVGDEVVLSGVYELKLATSGTAQKGGHFHADGSFHAEH